MAYIRRITQQGSSFARTWTTDLKTRHIRVNAVSPGSIDTPVANDLLTSTGAGHERLKMISAAIPLGRRGTADEIAKAVVFLASDDSSYVAGTELFVERFRSSVTRGWTGTSQLIG